MNRMDIEYQEYDIRNVLEFFVKGFEPQPGGKITSWDHFFDPVRGKVIFKLCVQSEVKAGGQ